MHVAVVRLRGEAPGVGLPILGGGDGAQEADIPRPCLPGPGDQQCPERKSLLGLPSNGTYCAPGSVRGMRVWGERQSLPSRS